MTPHQNCLVKTVLMRGPQHFSLRKIRKIIFELPYFFGYKTGVFSFQNNPKDLDPSFKTDLDLWDCLGRVKLVILQNIIGLI